ncbi:PTS glucitol/sorbitol transporter subunit IIA [Brevibacillus daliensis]|uniref:PTS glucitol/sorbitol transporter subunit IIA n=1 Tax=Brevibacillus daliensis TaxID=2892995 RepID=UPI001E3D52FC|nr:PTS glucitol/sorbitol transporter subunit IIA [Brevibacillus daliensis]
MSMIYRTTISDLGDSALDFIEDGMLILFKTGAPEDLAMFCVLHTENELTDTIEVGQTFSIGKNVAKITAVGDAVNTNLKELGHITLRFDGLVEAELPGCLHMEAIQLDKFEPGETITIIK